MLSDTVGGRAQQGPVLGVAVRDVPRHAARPVAREALDGPVLDGAVEAPLESHVRRVGFHFAVHFHFLVSRRRVHHVLIFLAQRGVCAKRGLRERKVELGTEVTDGYRFFRYQPLAPYDRE